MTTDKCRIFAMTSVGISERASEKKRGRGHRDGGKDDQVRQIE